MSAVATQTPVGGRSAAPPVGSLRPIAGLLLPYRALFSGGVATNLMVRVFTLGAALAGAYLVGRALTGAPTSDLWPLVWLIVVSSCRSPSSAGSRGRSSTCCRSGC